MIITTGDYFPHLNDLTKTHVTYNRKEINSPILNRYFKKVTIVEGITKTYSYEFPTIKKKV